MKDLTEEQKNVIRQLQKDAHENALNHGFWSNSTMYDIPDRLMRIVSEASEAMEDYRNAKDMKDLVEVKTTLWPSKDVGKPAGFPTELADIIIRVLDVSEWMGIDIIDVVLQKMAYNEKRPALHGRAR